MLDIKILASEIKIQDKNTKQHQDSRKNLNLVKLRSKKKTLS